MRVLSQQRLILLAAALSGFSPQMSVAQDAPQLPYVETLGQGVATLDYDVFTLVSQAKGMGATRANALADAAAKADNLRMILGRIEAVSGYNITASEPNITGIGPGCDGYNAQRCVPTSHQATIAFIINAKPATAAPTALVVLEEKGFTTSAPSYSLENSRIGDALARRAAFEDARSAADEAAVTARCRRGDLISMTLSQRADRKSVV